MNIMTEPLMDITAPRQTQVYPPQAPTALYSPETQDALTQARNDPGNAARCFYAAELLRAQGLYREAVRICCIGQMNNPFDWRLHLAKGYDYLMLELFPEAAASLELAVRLYPDSYEAWLYYAIAYTFLNDKEAAAYAFKWAEPLKSSEEEQDEFNLWHGVFRYKTERIPFTPPQESSRFLQFRADIALYAEGWRHILANDVENGASILNRCSQSPYRSLYTIAAGYDAPAYSI